MLVILILSKDQDDGLLRGNGVRRDLFRDGELPLIPVLLPKIFLFRGHARNPEAASLATTSLFPFDMESFHLLEGNHDRRLRRINQQPSAAFHTPCHRGFRGDTDHRKWFVLRRAILFANEFLDSVQVRINQQVRLGVDLRHSRLGIFLRAEIQEVPLFQSSQSAEDIVGLPDGIRAFPCLANPEIEAVRYSGHVLLL